MPWSPLPKRIEYALKALVCLAQSHKELSATQLEAAKKLASEWESKIKRRK